MVRRFRLSMPLVLSVLVAAVFVVAGMHALAGDGFPVGQDIGSPDEVASSSAVPAAPEPFAVETSWGQAIEVRATATGASLAAAAEGEDGPNDPQEGSNGACLDYNVLYEVDGVESPLAAYVEVEPGTMYVIDSSGGKVFVDFHDEGGNWLGWSDLAHSGVVPEDAAYGIICIGERGGYPDVPHVWATWFYMDGFEPLSDDDE